MANVKPTELEGLPAILERTRIERKLTQEQVGILLGLGETPANAGAFYSKVKHGEARLPPQKYLKLAQFLGFPVSMVLHEFPVDWSSTSVTSEETIDMQEILSLAAKLADCGNHLIPLGLLVLFLREEREARKPPD